VVQSDIVADIPGLDQYADYLFSSANESNETNVITVATPRIDAMLEAFKRQSVVTPSAISALDLDTGRYKNNNNPSRNSPAKTHPSPSAYDKRLQFLENQISDLLGRDSRASNDESVRSERSKKGDKSKSHVRSNHAADIRANARDLLKHDSDATDESDADSAASNFRPLTHHNIKSKNETRLPNSHRRFPVANKSVEKPSNDGEQKNLSNLSKNKTFGIASSRKASPKSPVSHGSMRGSADNGRQISKGSKTDEARRDELETTYVSLLQQLDEEKERRWKAEQAVKKLADRLQHELSKSKEDGEVQKASVDAVTRMKQTITDERDARLVVESEKDSVKKLCNEVTEKLNTEMTTTSELRKALRAKEEAASRTEQEYLKQDSLLSRKTQEAQLKSAALTREVDIVKIQAVNFKGQLQQMQELLANREQEHRRELEGRFSIGSKEFQEQLTKELAKQDKEHQREQRRLREETESIAKKYGELEDEFRLALYSEADRFKPLQTAFEKLSEENARNNAVLSVARDKDAKSSSLVAELTSVVKEQKGRMAELAKSKQEQVGELKERIQQLEVHLNEARHRMVTLEMLKQEKVKLGGQISAQESLIEGMKAEKRLWGDELAQQSSSLAQDRGRLEAKIETLQAEVASTKRHLERETDTVRIKTKIVEDQNETVRKLKDGLVERDAQIKEARDECLANQRVVEEQLASETEENKKIAEQLAREQARKEELKADVVDLKRDLDEANKKISHLNNRLKVGTFSSSIF